MTYECGDEAIFFWSHLEDWLTDSEALSIVKHMQEDDGVEAFRQLNCRFDPMTALTELHRLKAIQRFAENSRAKKNTEVPAVLAQFEDLLLRYSEDYSSEALSDDLKKEALKELIPSALEQCIKDVMMYHNVKEDTLSATQIRSIINERICADVQNQIIKMEVDAVHKEWAYGLGGKDTLPADPHRQPADEWVHSLGYGPNQGAIGKSGKGYGGGGEKGKGADDKGKGSGKDWKCAEGQGAWRRQG